MGTLRAVLIFVALSVTINIHAKFNSGRKQLTVRKVQSCAEPNKTTIQCTINKYNRTVQIFDLDINLTEDADDTKELHFELRRWSDGGWKHNFIQFQKSNFCSTAFFILNKGIEKFLVNCGREPRCPIKKGSFNVKNIALDFNETPMAVTTGRFLAIFKGLDKNKNTFLCIEVYVDAEEL